MKNNNLKWDKYNVQLFVNTNSRIKNDLRLETGLLYILVYIGTIIYIQNLLLKKNNILTSLTIIINMNIMKWKRSWKLK